MAWRAQVYPLSGIGNENGDNRPMAIGALIGLLVACVLTLANLVGRMVLGWGTLPELALDLVERGLPVPVVEAYLGSDSGPVRPLIFAGLLLGQVALGALVGAMVGVLRGRRYSDQARPRLGEALETRRALLERVSWAGLAVVGTYGFWRLITLPRPGPGMGTTPGSRGTRPGAAGTVTEATSSADFYVVSKNLIDPRVKSDDWRLRVHGLVARELSLTYAELRALSKVEQWQTLICISNDTGGDYAGNALWSGVPLGELLRRAGVQPDARRVFFRAADEYADGIPLTTALRPETLVVTEMNGAPLLPEHGFPARLLVPGVYGLKNVKWLQSIEVIDSERRGFWQQRGWTDSAVVKTTTRIDVPRRGNVAAVSAARVAGMAFAGDRGISAVEVSLDGGTTWRPAYLAEPKGPLSWTLWELPWQPSPGEYQLLARAVDGRGDPQPSRFAATLPDGAAGYHRVAVTVV